MNKIFSNEIGTEVFIRNLQILNEEIPSDRYIDEEYREFIKKSLLDEEGEINVNHESKFRDWSKLHG